MASPCKTPLKKIPAIDIFESPKWLQDERPSILGHDLTITVSTPNGSNSNLLASKFFNAVRAKQIDRTLSDNQALTDENIELRGRLNDALVLVDEYKVKNALLEEKLAYAYKVIEVHAIKLEEEEKLQSMPEIILEDPIEEIPEIILEEDVIADSPPTKKKGRRSALLTPNVDDGLLEGVEPAKVMPKKKKKGRKSVQLMKEKRRSNVNLDPNNNNTNDDEQPRKMKRRSVQMKTNPLARSKGAIKKWVNTKVKPLPDFSKVHLPEVTKRDLTRPDPFSVYNKPTRASLLRSESIRQHMEILRNKTMNNK